MTTHDHREIVVGCYRCELNADELDPRSDVKSPAEPTVDRRGEITSAECAAVDHDLMTHFAAGLDCECDCHQSTSQYPDCPTFPHNWVDCPGDSIVDHDPKRPGVGMDRDTRLDAHPKDLS